MTTSTSHSDKALDKETLEALDIIAIQLESFGLHEEADSVKHKRAAIANGTPILSPKTICALMETDPVLQGITEEYNERNLQVRRGNNEAMSLVTRFYIRVLELSGGVASRKQTDSIVATTLRLPISKMNYLVTGAIGDKLLAIDNEDYSKLRVVVPTAG